MRAGTLVVDIAANVARLAQDMASARGVVASAMNDITRSVNVAKTALGALGVGLSAGALASMASDIVKATAALDDMAEVTGTTVENLSRFSVVAKIGGQDMGLVESSLVKLTKGLQGTDEETRNAANALKILGLQAKDATGNLRDPGELMREISTRLAQFEDGAGKTAVALSLFGKSGAQLLPFLKDLAEEGAVAARVTAQQAAEAEKLEKNLRRLGIAGEDAKREFMTGVTPALVDLTEKMIDAHKAAGNLATALLLVATGGQTLDQIDAEISSIEGKSGVRKWAERGLTMGMSGVVDSAKLSLLHRQRDFAMIRLGRNAQGMAQDAAGNIVDPKSMEGKSRLPWKPLGSPATAAEEANLLLGLRKQLDGAYGQASVFDDVMRKLTEGTKAYSHETTAAALALAGEIDKLQTASAYMKSYMEHVNAVTEAEQARNDAFYGFLSSSNQRLRDMQFENGLIESQGSIVQRTLAPKQEQIRLEIELNAAREKAIQFKQIDLAADKAAIDQLPAVVEQIYALAAAKKVELGALIDDKAARTLARDSAAAAADEWRSAQAGLWQSIDQTAHDTWVSIFQSGKSTFDRLRDTLKNGLYDLLYQMTARPFLIQIAASLSGTGVAQSAFGAAANGFNPLGMFSNASSAYSLFSGNSFLGNGVSSIFGGGSGTMLGGASALPGILGTGAAEEAAALGIAQVGGAGLGVLGTALPWVGGALAVGSLLGMFGGGGGPKASDVVLQKLPSGQLHFGNNNVTDSPWAENYSYTFDAAYRALGPKGQAFLDQYAGRTWSASGPDSAQNLVSQNIAPLLQQAQALDAGEKQVADSQSTARAALLAAKDPKGYWGGQVATLGGELGSTATTIEAWRDQFLKALDDTLSQDQLDKWNRLGDAIARASDTAGNAADSIATSKFSTLVDYRRAVRLAGGVPRFAAGGEHAGGWRVVGERGEELEFTGPSRIFSNAESRQLLDTSRLEERIGRLESTLVAIARSTGKSARLHDRWDGDGLPPERPA